MSRVETEARDEERLKVGKAEDVAWLNPNPKPDGVMKVYYICINTYIHTCIIYTHTTESI